MDAISWTFVIVFGVAFVSAVTYSIVQHIREQKEKVHEN